MNWRIGYWVSQNKCFHYQFVLPTLQSAFMLIAGISLGDQHILANTEPKICVICSIHTNNTSKTNYLFEPLLQIPNTLSQILEKPQQTIAEPTKFTRLPVGLNVGKNPVVESTFVKGAEDGQQAIDFENWLVSFNDVKQVLNLDIKTLDDGQLEVRSAGLRTRINPQELKTDPELGLVISIADIQTKFGVKCEFNLIDYAIVFNLPWLNLEEKQTEQKTLPVILDGLTKVPAPSFTLAAMGQQINITGNSNSNSIQSQGNLTAIGSLLGGSVTLKMNQSDLTDTNTWRLDEAQYLRQTPNADYIVGSQPTFWQTQGKGSYWGFTTIQRLGFTSPTPSGGGFSPSQRLQTGEINRTITGEAKPGTLVQLKSGISNTVFAEVLVDSSGIYRFGNIPMGGINGNSYRVYLYPNGQLTAQPKIEEAKFTILSGQLSPKTSALIISTGLSQQPSKNNVIGNFQDWRGGVAYRLGVTEELTVGAGVIYDQSLLGLGELFYQPQKFPLRVNASLLMGTQKRGWDYNANINFNPSPQFSLNFLSDRLSQRFELNWQALNGVGFKFSSDTRENTFNAGVNLALIAHNFSIFSSVDVDTKNRLRWNISSSLANLQFTHRQNEIGANTELNYNFSGSSQLGNSLTIGYETLDYNNYDYLATAKFRYRSKTLTNGYRPLWEFDLGYGIGSRGNGLIGSVSTAIIPGLTLGLRYQEISPTSNDMSFKIELSPSFNLQPQLSLGDSRFDRLRSEGGLFVQPFLDNNGNNIYDKNEEIYTQDTDLLLIINNQTIKSLPTDLTSKGVFIKLTPGFYRLDLDPAGYPINRKPLESSYAVEVVAGGYTTVRVPMTLSYTVAGRVTVSGGNPVGGVKVEAILSQLGKSKKTIVSITNGAGIFFLEELQPGIYNLLVNGQPAQPGRIEINQNSKTLQELNLVINN
ncbi:carboxypeptidase regulatory-like domain-containing protein [Nostoc sp. UHCC 0702]|nr:carboxypeptidase regulatory-like domain-containing protein [Nostoc sp. UHCC 0702]